MDFLAFRKCLYLLSLFYFFSSLVTFCHKLSQPDNSGLPRRCFGVVSKSKSLETIPVHMLLAQHLTNNSNVIHWRWTCIWLATLTLSILISLNLMSYIVSDGNLGRDKLSKIFSLMDWETRKQCRSAWWWDLECGRSLQKIEIHGLQE